MTAHATSTARTRGPLNYRGTAGILTPPANTTVEPELNSLVPEGLSLHAVRMPGRNSDDTSIGLRERFLGYVDALASASDSFGGMRLDALLFACTGCSYLVEASGENELIEAMKSAGGAHVQTAAGAVRTVLERAEFTSLALVSPYPEWLTEAAVAYWTSLGYTVTDVTPASTGSSIYAIQPNEVAAAIARLARTTADVVVLSGTGMATASVIEQVGTDSRVPLLSPNTCAAWWLTSTLAPDAMQASRPAVTSIDHLVRDGR
jgi:maleate isomerase